MCLRPTYQFKMKRKEMPTSSLSCLVNERRTNATGSILPGGRPMPNKINSKMRIRYYKFYHINECYNPRNDMNIPILKRGKPRFPLK